MNAVPPPPPDFYMLIPLQASPQVSVAEKDRLSRQSTEGLDDDSEGGASRRFSSYTDWSSDIPAEYRLEDVETASIDSPSIGESSVADFDSTSTPGHGKSKASELAKTKICRFFRKGFCNKGETCNFAHGQSSLRPTLHRSRPCDDLQKGSDQLYKENSQNDQVVGAEPLEYIGCTKSPSNAESGYSVFIKNTFLHIADSDAIGVHLRRCSSDSIL
jgi:hypothetical protein